MPDEHRGPAVQEALEVIDVVCNTERSRVRNGAPVAATVVAENPEPGLQDPRDPGHPCRPVERSVHENHERGTDRARFLRVDECRGGAHMVI